jgi:hypothetical protein
VIQGVLKKHRTVAFSLVIRVDAYRIEVIMRLPWSLNLAGIYKAEEPTHFAKARPIEISGYHRDPR